MCFNRMIFKKLMFSSSFFRKLYSLIIKKPYLLIFLFAMSSCSVHEDRSDCPSNLSLEFSSVYETIEKYEQEDISNIDVFSKVLLLLKGEDGLVSLDTLENYPTKHESRLPRMKYDFFLICGDFSFFDLKEGLKIPLGAESPKIYLSHDSLNLNEEEVIYNAKFWKAYSDVCIRIKSKFIIQDYGFTINLVGNSVGYDLFGNAIEGKFKAPCRKDLNGLFHCRVPRQLDKSLKMEIVSDSESKGEILRIFALGEFLAELGYDWTLDSLLDVYVEVDYALSTLQVDVIIPPRKISFDLIL